MNKNCYRVIFNKTRGMLMVVAEIAASHGGASLSSTGRPALPQHVSMLTRLRLALLAALGLVSFAAGAGIVADGQASGNQQPTIISAANGTPQINIQTPGAAGVSRNIYSQFDVDKKGAVLNNSHANTQTQLAGMVTGNPWLAKGEAKIILNEVNSRNASQLNGFIEVAGKKAQVVIANPAGITCDGCGFINASRATLTTGQAIFNNGQLTGYDVERGEIVIQGAGLDSRQQDKTDLIARAVKVNAGLWANELNVTTGRNKVDADHQTITAKTAGGSDKPALAIDVAQLGGMYANKIRLRGTEAGVGVHNAGSIGAGEVAIDASGMLTNLGSLSAAENLTIAAQGALINQGKIHAASNVDLYSKAQLTNTGSLSATQNVSLTAASINSTSSGLLVAGVSSDGKRGANGNLTLNSQGEIRANGQNSAVGKLAISGASLDLSGSQTSADTIALNATSSDISTASSNIAAAHQLVTQTNQTLNNDGGTIAAEKLDLTANALSNQKGIIQQTGAEDLRLSHAASINNRQGTISSKSKNLTLKSASLNNEQGKILHDADGELSLEVSQLAGTQGLMLSNGALSLSGAALTLDNAVTQANSVTIATDALSNRAGQLLQNGDGPMRLSVTDLLDNEKGIIAANGDITLNAGDLHNQQGKLIANKRAGIKVTLDNELNNSEGIIAAEGDLTLESQAVDNRAGLLQSGGLLSLNSRQHELLNSGGELFSAGDIRLNTGFITNYEGQISAQNLIVKASDLHNQNGTLQAQNSLSVSGDQLNNLQGLLAAGETLHIEAVALDNSHNGTLASDGSLSLNASSVVNNSGRIQAQRELAMSATDINN